MLGGLSCIRFSDRYNAVYDPEIFHEMMIKAVMAGSNRASVVNAVRKLIYFSKYILKNS